MIRSAYSKSFVGRRKQLQLLVERYRAAESGEGSIVVVAGEAGAGKTRLLSEFCSTIPAQERCAVGRSLEYIRLPYAPFLAALGQLATNNPDALSAAPQIRAGLAHLVPELREPDDAIFPPPDKLRQFNMMAEALTRFGSDRPAVVVIEDLQWADSGTLELLMHLPSYLQAAHVLLIVTYRSDELLRDSPLRSALAKLERNRCVFNMDLEPLDRQQIHALIFNSLERGETLPARVVTAICAKAEGNPLFAEELLKNVLGNVEDLKQKLPATVQEAVRERLRGLTDDEHSILLHAAALGRRFKAEFLAEILDRSVEEIMPVLKRAIELGLIVEESNGAVSYRFKHELQREAIYGELLAAQAQRLHRKIALSLEAANGEAMIAELAYHWWQANVLSKAARYCEKAGDAAFAIFAYSDAMVSYERALGAGVAAGVRRAELRLKLARALHQAGLGERAKEAALFALADYEDAGEVENAARVCLTLAELCGALGDTTGIGSFAQRALRLIQFDVDSPIYFAAHVEMMVLNVAYRGDFDRARNHMAEAQRFTGSRPPAAEIRFLEMTTALAALSGNPREALAHTQDAAALAARNQDAVSALRCWGNFAAGMAQIGESQLALLGFEQAQQLIREQKVGGLSAAWVLIDYANTVLHLGRLQEACELVERALSSDVELPTYRIRVAQTGIVAGLWLERSEIVERCAQPALVEAALESSEAMIIGATASFAERYAALGHIADACTVLKRALDALERIDARPGPGDHDKLFVAVARYGDDSDAMLARGYLERVVRASNVRSSPACLALVDAYINARQARTEQANVKALEAARLFEDIGWPHYQAQALELLGKEEEALEIYRRIGDVRDEKRLEAKRAPANRRGRSPDELTAREREIMSLLTAGKSNRAIAELLVISERTVENHVSSILAKLGADSRAELIAHSTNSRSAAGHRSGKRAK